MSGAVVEVTDGTFEERVLRADVPVLVEFTASWCAPCRALAPALAAVAAAHRDRLRVAALDVDSEHVTAERYGIRSMPTLLLFQRGRVVQQLSGAVSRARLEELVRPVIAPGAGVGGSRA